MAALPQALTQQEDPVQQFGTLTHLGQDGLHTVRCGAHDWRVRCAASCLLAPSVGDTVLLSGPSPSHTYLIAVITQANASAARIEVPGDLSLAARQGRITVHAAEGLALNGGRRLSLDSETLAVNAAQARLAMQDTEYLGVGVRATVASLRVVGRACEVVMDRISHLAQSIFRLAEQVEQVRAGRLDYQAEQTARVHARQTLVTGRDIVKIDADQIHMG